MVGKTSVRNKDNPGNYTTKTAGAVHDLNLCAAQIHTNGVVFITPEVICMRATGDICSRVAVSFDLGIFPGSPCAAVVFSRA